jgi:kynurenine formamidase
MEYLLGASITAITIFFTYRWLIKNAAPLKSLKVVATQSRTNELIKKILIPDQSFPKATSQAMKHFDSRSVRVLIIDSQAYWITDNTVFAADVVNGEVQKDTAKEVDTMDMDKVQLKKMIFIVEKLKEGL